MIMGFFVWGPNQWAGDNIVHFVECYHPHAVSYGNGMIVLHGKDPKDHTPAYFVFPTNSRAG